MRRTAIMIAGIAILLGVSAMAQESRSEISLQGTGFFTKDTTGDGTTERSTNAGGFLVGYRYNLTRWLAAEAVYGYDRNSQHYFGSGGLSRVQANVHQATGGFVVRIPTSPRFRFSPYVLAEGGALVFDPTGNAFGTVAGAQRQATGVFACGGGADFPILKHIALRAEFRRSLKAFLHLRSKDQPSRTHCTDCGSICMHLPAQFWLDGDEETFGIRLPFCPQCNPELLSRVPAVA